MPVQFYIDIQFLSNVSSYFFILFSNTELTMQEATRHYAEDFCNIEPNPSVVTWAFMSPQIQYGPCLEKEPITSPLPLLTSPFLPPGIDDWASLPNI